LQLKITIEGLDQTMKDLEKEINQFQTFLASTLKQEIVPRTPIDKGRARAGWQQRTQGSTQTVENRVPYIERLQKGYSRQAPNGFVNQAISATIAKTKRIIK
jgi:hypothetical protein